MEYTTRAAYKERLQSHFAKYPRRPILTHLNADTSWLISIPVPRSIATKPSSNSNHDHANTITSPYCYHLIIDAWLEGRITVGVKAFISFAHKIQSAFQTFDAVLDMIGLIEEGAAAYLNNQPDQDRRFRPPSPPRIDLMISSHIANDHLDRATLTQVDPTTPMMVVDEAVSTVASWKHFETVEAMPDFHSLAVLESHVYKVLPAWLKVGRIPSGERFPALHHGLLITFEPDPDTGGRDRNFLEGIVYTPHGFFPKQFKPLLPSFMSDQAVNGNRNHKQVDEAKNGSLPRIKYLALLHGLAKAWDKVTGTVNLGVENGLVLQQMTGAKYWVPTHDEVLDYTGIMGYLQNKDMGSVEGAVEKSGSLVQLRSGQEVEQSPEGTCFIKELGNGETLSLA